MSEQFVLKEERAGELGGFISFLIVLFMLGPVFLVVAGVYNEYKLENIIGVTFGLIIVSLVLICAIAWYKDEGTSKVKDE